MRTFFLLMVDPNRTDLQSVLDDNLDGPSLVPLWRGIAGDSFIFANARLVVAHKPPADLLGNALSLRIMSDRLLSIIRSFVTEDDLQVFSAPLIDALTRKPILGYSVVNCLRTIEALAPGCNPRRLLVEPLVLKQAAVPASVHYFRLVEDPLIGLISEELQAAIFQQDLQGVLTVPMKTTA